MYNEAALSEEVVEFEDWNKQKLVLVVKSISGKLFLDARKWRKSTKGY